MHGRNWAKNIRFRADELRFPKDVQMLAALVRDSARVKVIGSRHSFNRLADSSALHVCLEELPRRVVIDVEARRVTVTGGLPYGAFCAELDRQGCALHNLASLPHISVAGACATGTHGSGMRHGNLATAVVGLTLVKADGEVVRLERGDEDFGLAVVGLGAVGIVAEVTLELLPAFEVKQWVYESLSAENLEEYFEEIMGCAYSVSLFTDWSDDTFDQVWIKERVDDPHVGAEVLAAARSTLRKNGASAASAPVHPVREDPAACTAQLGAPGPWHERLPHFRMEFTPSSGNELQSEYFVATRDGPAALRALAELRHEIAELVLVTEVRSIAADELLMSPHFGRDSIAIHFTWRQQLQPGEEMRASGLSPEVESALQKVERVLDPFDPRPHLGKLFTMSPARLSEVYPKVGEFRERVRKDFDPSGKFRNEFLAHYVLGE